MDFGEHSRVARSGWSRTMRGRAQEQALDGIHRAEVRGPQETWVGASLDRQRLRGIFRMMRCKFLGFVGFGKHCANTIGADWKERGLL